MFLKLLPELREMVLWYCNGEDIKNLTCCSREYKDDLKEILWHTVNIPFKQLKENQFKDEKVIEDLKHTKILHIGPEFGSVYNLLRGSGKFRTVLQHCNPSVIYTSFVPNDAFNVLGKFDKLVDLYLTSFAANDQTIRAIHNTLMGLKSLSVKGGLVTDKGLSNLDALKNLEKLDLSHCYRITDTGLSHVGTILSLTELDVSVCYGITTMGLSHLSKLVLLEKLHLSSCHHITDEGLSHIASLSTLRELDISMCHGVTDAGLDYLQQLVKLEKLNVSACNQITEMGLLHISANCTIKR